MLKAMKPTNKHYMEIQTFQTEKEGIILAMYPRVKLDKYQNIQKL